MELKLSESEYRILVNMVYIADWVIHSHKADIDQDTKEYRDFEQKIYKLADKMGCADLIEFDEEMKEYYPTTSFEEEGESMKLLEEFENDTFWDELIERLVSRDVEKLMGKDILKKENIKKYFKAEGPIREKYTNEFSSRGIDNLKIRAC